jgi:catechol 2,3-dioxygenase-like lactoylglutathione lyase family enzyme
VAFVTAPALLPYRYLHCNLNCPDAPALADFYVGALGMRAVMRSGGPDSAPQDGESLGVAGQVRCDTWFVYDDRGPRSAPGVELQQWYDPPLVGSPYPSGDAIGVQALGFSVADVTATVARALSLGATRHSDESGWATLLDPAGVTLDLVGPAAAPCEQQTRLRHVRQTCRDLGRSLDWYQALGFAPVAANTAASDGVGTALQLPAQSHQLLLVPTRESSNEAYAVAHHAGLFRTAMAVPDVAAVAAALASQGIGPGPEGVRQVHLTGTAVGTLSILFLRDPDGIMVELVERDSGVFR